MCITKYAATKVGRHTTAIKNNSNKNLANFIGQLLNIDYLPLPVVDAIAD